LEQTYLILALVETGAIDTPFFKGLDGKELILSLAMLIREHHKNFYADYHMAYWTASNFFKYLAECKELKIDIEKLKTVYDNINEKGEEHYEFTVFERLGRENEERGNIKTASSQRSDGSASTK